MSKAFIPKESTMDHHPLLFEELDIGPVCTIRRINRRRMGKAEKKELKRMKRLQAAFYFRRSVQERRNRFSPRVSEADDVGNDERWMPEDVAKLHRALLRQSVAQLGRVNPVSDLFRDLAAWFDDESMRPFSFTACCRLEGIDPAGKLTEEVTVFLTTCLTACGTQTRKGRAVHAWMAGSPDAPLSFERCCELTGHDPREVRRLKAA